MSSKDIDLLLSLIEQLVNAEGMTWDAKAQLVLEQASENDRINLEEFSSWFGP